jgi:DNA-3-methyladenine glycosylase II
MKKHPINTHADINAGLQYLANADPRLVAVIEKAGAIPLRLQTPGFEGLASIIISQMVSRASANAIWQRLLASSGQTLEPDHILTLTPETLAAIGLSRAKISALQALAGAVLAGDLDLAGIMAMDDREAMQALTAVKGIGPWTAEIYLMFSAGHPDIFPSGDIALQNAVAHAFSLPQRPTGRTLSAMAEIWQPCRSVAARLFWAYYAREMRRSILPVAEK